jgi:large subunit ribosomal protein L24
MSLTIKKGDNVVVIAGKDKKKTGKVLEVSPKDGKVLVENVNIVTKHNKPRSQQDKGGIAKKPAAIDASNVMVVCPVCGKATRVAHTEVDGKKVRSCKKCNASLDKEFVKASKKAAKKQKSKAKTAENN